MRVTPVRVDIKRLALRSWTLMPSGVWDVPHPINHGFIVHRNAKARDERLPLPWCVFYLWFER